jgi:hypothetical protein
MGERLARPRGPGGCRALRRDLRLSRLVRAADNLPDAEADARYERELADRALDEAQLDAYWRPWTVVMPNGERREITPPHVEPDGYLTWRW